MLARQTLVQELELITSANKSNDLIACHTEHLCTELETSVGYGDLFRVQFFCISSLFFLLLFVSGTLLKAHQYSVDSKKMSLQFCLPKTPLSIFCMETSV